MNEIQRDLFAKIKEAICNSVEFYPVRYNAIKVDTPFLDWVGESVSIYITEDGRITDGDQTLNQIRALRIFDDFEYWPYRIDYFERYNISRVRGSLDLCHLESSEGILRYIQGISRLPTLFEPRPIADKEDRFPQFVRKAVTDTLINRYPDRPDEDVLNWAAKLVQPWSYNLDGIVIHSDMSPVNKNKIIKIISHATSNDSEKRQHITSKLFDPLIWEKKNPHVMTVAVTSDLSNYPEDSQNLLHIRANEIIELKDESATMQLARSLAKA